MAVNGVYDSADYNFGSLASIRKQAEAIRQRAIAQREARIAEQDETGLIQNPDTGEMVELSSISEETREKWNNRLDMRNISPGEAMIMFKATDPNAETVEKSKELGKKYEKLQNKLLSGKTLTAEEKRFLRENNYTYLANMADRMEQEAEQLKKSLRGCKSKDEARQVYINVKTRLMGASSKNDGSFLFLSAALDKAYSQYMKQGTSKLNILA